MGMEIEVRPFGLRARDDCESAWQWRPCDWPLLDVLIGIASGKYPNWQSLANDLAEDETIIERVLSNYRKGAR